MGVIGPGDEAFVVGLFTGWEGKNKISPIVRYGNVAMMAGDAPAHLIELFSTPGLSGSPVYAHETVFLTATPIGKEGKYPRATMAVGKIYLIGLVKALMPVKVLGEKFDHTWHSGITMVEPSTQLLEIINRPDLIAYERDLDEQMKRIDNGLPPIPTSSGDSPEAPTKATKRKRTVTIPPTGRKDFLDN